MNALHLQPAVGLLNEDVVGNVGEVLWVLLGSIGILLLIACANTAYCWFGRKAADRNLRCAPRLGRGRIARALIVESLTLSLAGVLIGVGVAYGALQVLLAHGPATVPRLNETTIDLPAVLVIAALIASYVPARRAAAVDPVETL
jgi:hypothetical protein